MPRKRVTDAQRNALREHAPDVYALLDKDAARSLGELRAQRTICANAARALHERAESENRDFTDAERQAFDGALAAAENFAAAEHVEEQRAEVQRHLDAGGGGNPDAIRGHEREPESWLDLRTGRRVRVLHQGESFRAAIADRIDPEQEEAYRDLTLGGLLRAMITGPRSDAERRALSEGTDSAGGVSVPTILMARFIDKLRAATVVFRAGARTVPLESDATDLAKIVTDPTTAWRAENSEISGSDPTFTKITFAPESLGSLVRVSRELLQDSVNIETMLERAFTASFANAMDSAALQGAGASNEPAGLTQLTDINKIDHGGAALTDYSAFITAMREILGDNAMAPTAVVLHPFHWTALGALVDTTNQPLQMPPILQQLRWLTTTGIDLGGSPDERNIFVGAWIEMLIGMREQLRVELLRERYAEFNQFGFLAHARMDVAVEHDESFAIIQRVAAQ